MKNLLTILLIFTLIGCNSYESNKEDLSIPLKQIIVDGTYFDDRSAQFLVLSMKELFSEFYSENINNLKGIPKLDSLLIATENFQKGGYHNAALFASRKKTTNAYLTDTLKMSTKYSNLHLNVVSGFEKNKQIVIVDANNNNDFSDDEVFKFEKDFRIFKNNTPSVNDKLIKIDTLSPIDVKFQFNYNGNTYKLSRKVQIYPSSNYFTTQLLGEGEIKDFSLGMRLKDYFKGKLIYNKTSYDIGLQGLNKDRMTVMIKPSSYKYDSNDTNFNQNFEYRINDTIQLSESYFKIDSIAYDMSELFLKKLKLKGDYFSRRIGTKLKDFKLTDLDGGSYRISDINNGLKKYTLIDFWGTWCAPCKELTPELIRLDKVYSDKLNIISIAYDKNIENVKAYIAENNIKWSQAFDNRNKRSKLNRELGVSSYPTFILLNDKGEIIYRGGSESLKKIEQLIQ